MSKLEVRRMKLAVYSAVSGVRSLQHPGESFSFHANASVVPAKQTLQQVHA